MKADRPELPAPLNSSVPEASPQSEALTAKHLREITELQQRLFHSEHEAARLHRELTAIYAGNFWKAARLYYQARDRVKSIRILARFVRKLLQALRPAPNRAGSTIAPMRIGGGAARSDHPRAIPEVALPNKGKVSLILPSGEHAERLEAAIHSLLAQTYAHFEVLLVPSAASSVAPGLDAVLARYRSHPQVIVLDHERGTFPAALNRAFHLSQGEFVAWMRPDCLMGPRYLEEMVSCLELRHDAGMAYSDYHLLEAHGPSVAANPSTGSHDAGIVRLPQAVALESLGAEGDLFGPAVVYRRAVVWALGELAEDLGPWAPQEYGARVRHLFDAIHVPKSFFQSRVVAPPSAEEACRKRLSERNKARNDFLASPLAVRTFGLDLTIEKVESAAPNQLYVYDAAYAEAVEPREAVNLYVCVIGDRPWEEVDREGLVNADLILTTQPQVFCALEEAFPYRVFLLDLTRSMDLAFFLKVAQNRLFDKLNARKGPSLPLGVSVQSPLKVAFQVDSLDRGGLEEVVFQLVTNLERHRISPSVVINHHLLGFLGNRLREMGVSVHLLAQQEHDLCRLLETERFDAVNFHHSLFGVDLYKQAGVSTLYTFHTSYTWFSAEQTQEWRNGLAQIDHFAAVSRQVRDYAAHKFGLPLNRIPIIPNGLDTRDFPPRATLSRADFGISEDDFVFLHVGSFNGPKYHHLMLSALEELLPQFPAMKLIFVGNILDKTYFGKLQERVVRGNFGDRLAIFDFLPKAQLADLYRVSNCFVLPSLQEGCSVAALEAMHFGLPLILTDVGSARDVIENEDLGIIIPNPYPSIRGVRLDDLMQLTYEPAPSNLPYLVDAMSRVYGDYAIWQEKGRQGNRKIADRFTPQEMAKAYEGLLQQTVARHSKQTWSFLV